MYQEFFEKLNEVDNVVLSDFVGDEDYTWDDSDESLEDILYWDYILEKELYERHNMKYIEEDWKKAPFTKGMVVMLNNKLPGEGLHRLYVITQVYDHDGNPLYDGYILSSKINKANLVNPNYPANILIKNYGSILSSGTKVNKDAIIKLDGRRTVDNTYFEPAGTIKGYCTIDFQTFIDNEVNKINNNQDTSQDYWDNGVPVITY